MRLTIGRLVESVAIFPNSVRRSIGDQDDDLYRILLPLHIQRLCQCGRLCLRTVTASRRDQTREVLLHLLCISRESKVLRDIAVILRRVITERDQAEANRRFGKGGGGGDFVANVLDGRARRFDVGSLATCRVLEEEDVAGKAVCSIVRLGS